MQLKQKKLFKEEDSKIFTGDIYNIYQELCKRINMEVLTQRRVGDIVAELDMLGLINARVISKGRYGRTKEVKLSLPSNLIERIKEILKNSLGI